jgi:hypothetical protein
MNNSSLVVVKLNEEFRNLEEKNLSEELSVMPHDAPEAFKLRA